MWRVVIAVLLGTAVWTVGVFAFPRDDNFAVFAAPLAGAVASVALMGLVIVPLRAVLRRLLSATGSWVQCVAAVVFIALVVAGLCTLLPTGALSETRSSAFTLWLAYGLSLTLPIFWPANASFAA